MNIFHGVAGILTHTHDQPVVEPKNMLSSELLQKPTETDLNEK